MFDFLMADIYAISDKCVVYSTDVKGISVDELSERFMQEHEFLDAIYHFLQNEKSNMDEIALTGKKLFQLANVPDPKYTDCYDMVAEIKADLEKLLGRIESVAKRADIGVANYLAGQYQTLKSHITFYRNFLEETEPEGYSEYDENENESK